MKHLLAVALLLAAASGARAQDSAGAPVDAGTSGRELRAPRDRDDVGFVVFGGRAPARGDGLRSLASAVETTNLLDPDFVVALGDVVDPGMKPETWRKRAADVRRVMSKLAAPWYPVAGERDPAGDDDALWRETFGPLRYSFDLRFAHFVLLAADEPAESATSGGSPDADAERVWLTADLAKAKAEQVFVFLHGPRWLDDAAGWSDVHELLAADGRVRAVFAGHLATWRDDGVKDGVHYYVVAMPGGDAVDEEPDDAQHVAQVRVRREGFTVANVEVGSVRGGDMALGAEVDALADLARGDSLDIEGTPAIEFEEGKASTFRIVIRNATDRPLPWEMTVDADEGWQLEVGSVRGTAAPLATVRIPVRAVAPAYPQRRQDVRVSATITYALASGLKRQIRSSVSAAAKLGVPKSASAAHPDANKALVLDGKSCVRVTLPREEIAPAKLTVECWAKPGRASTKTMSLVSNASRSGFGLELGTRPKGEVAPTALVHVPRLALTKKPGWARADAKEKLADGAWTHLALVWDGATVRLFVGGKLAGEAAAPAPMTTNSLPLYVGADPNTRGDPEDRFAGAIDEVRVSRVVRYVAPFQPERVFVRDDDTLLLLHFDTDDFGLSLDDSGRENHGWPAGEPRIEDVKR